MTEYWGRPSLRFSIAITLVGILLTGGSSFLGYNEVNFYIRSLKAEGVITNRWVEGPGSPDDAGNTYYIYGVEILFVNGKTGEQNTVYYHRVDWKIGDKKPILYDPDNPTNFRIGYWYTDGLLTYDFFHILIVFSLFCGVLFLFFGGRDWYTVHTTGHHYDGTVSKH